MLTGAGISRESGLDTFRDKGGIWSQVRLEEVATPEAFRRDPARVHAFYNARRRQLAAVRPNAAHLALAQLERRLDRQPGAALLIVTQNVDDLHERGGSRRLLHMHGELLRARCAACQARPDWSADTGAAVSCPSCGAAALRPDVVWFGEMPMHMPAIERALARCTLFISIGTSGTVTPAADFVRMAAGPRIELNLQPSGERAFEHAVAGPAGETVPALVRELLGA